MSETYYLEFRMKILEQEQLLSIVKDQEKVAKEAKDLGFLRFLVAKREEIQTEIYSTRLAQSIRLAKLAIQEARITIEKMDKTGAVKQSPTGVE